jgi:16S rRNA processing protein RimM
MRLVPVSGDPTRIEALTRVWIVGGDALTRQHAVQAVRRHGEAALVTLSGVGDRDQAAELVNAEVWALGSELPRRGAGEFGLDEVVGAVLLDGDRRVGSIVGVASGAGRDFLEVEHEGRTVLVPAVKEWLVEMDLAGRRIVMRLPPGLLEA